MKKLISLMKEYGPVAISALPTLAFAQANPSGGNVPPPPANLTNLQGVLNLVCTLFGWAFFGLIALSMVFVIVAAFKYLTAAGDPEKVKTAGSTLLYAAVAVGVALLAKAIPTLVATFLGGGALTAC